MTRSRRWDSVWSWWATAARSTATPQVATSSTGGSSHSPPNSPSGRRRTSTTDPARSIHASVRASTGSSLSFLRTGITGSSSWRPVRAASQCGARGQIRQRGDVGVHTVAPSSIRPWLRSPGAWPAGSAAISSPARAHSALPPALDLMSCGIANTRASTRATLPSTSGARSPYAIEAIAPAVYGPMPGTSRSSAAERGRAPSHLASAACAPL